MNYFDRQIREAKDNYNYFFIKMFFDVFKNFFKLSIILLISGIFDYVIINIIALIFTIYSLFNVVFVCKYYLNIIGDIKNTLGYDLSLEIDFNLIRGNIFKGVVKYGK